MAQEDPIIALVICENNGDLLVLEDRSSCSGTMV